VEKATQETVCKMPQRAQVVAKSALPELSVLESCAISTTCIHCAFVVR
jgi:hypothetical protein